MPTINQLVRHGRKPKRYHSRAPALEGAPQLAGIVLSVKVIKPKKPNSANRCCCKVRLSNGREITAKIPGEANNISEHMEVLVRGASVPDLPGVKYAIIRGALGAGGVGHVPKWGVSRRQSRSRYGTKLRQKGV